MKNKFKFFLRCLVVRLKYLIWAYKRINDLHLGDIVLYKNEKCLLIQGVANPFWDLLPFNDENLKKEIRTVYKNINCNDFTLDRTFKRNFFAFKSSFLFQMLNWYKIDIYSKNVFDKISYK